MPLILRNNLTRPLTHNELDGNLIYLNIAEWVKKGYLEGQYVLIKTDTIGIIYYCEMTHTDFIYNQYGAGNFIETYVEGSTTHRVWRQIGSSNGDVTGYTFNDTVATIELSDGNKFDIDINDVQISGLQYSVGVSNHSYQLITTGWTQEVISGDTYNTHDLVFGGMTQAAKQNIVVIDLNTSDNYHHLVYLPTGVTINDAGVIYKVIAKSSNNTNLDKYLMIYSPDLRIIATNIKTKYNDSYFLPLETMESVEIIWDGYDYLVTNMVKQGYVALNAKNFIEMDPDVDPLYDTCYIQRDINQLL